MLKSLWHNSTPILDQNSQENRQQCLPATGGGELRLLRAQAHKMSIWLPPNPVSAVTNFRPRLLHEQSFSLLVPLPSSRPELRETLHMHHPYTVTWDKAQQPDEGWCWRLGSSIMQKQRLLWTAGWARARPTSGTAHFSLSRLTTSLLFLSHHVSVLPTSQQGVSILHIPASLPSP